jgi:allophanate hydrolase
MVMGETVAAIVEAHRAGASIEATVARCYARIRAPDDPAIFITLRAEADAIAEAKMLAAEADADGSLAERPLYGVPVAVKDNIDVAGLPTTAACPAFAYTPAKDQPASRASSAPAPSSSARPISISSRPDWWACARPMASRATCSIRR